MSLTREQGYFLQKASRALSRNRFILYSGDAAYRLMRGRKNKAVSLNADPNKDPHIFSENLPCWTGTVVGIDIKVDTGVQFADLLDQIRKAYFIDVKARQDYARKIRFSR